jgi:DNA transformation protein
LKSATPAPPPSGPGETTRLLNLGERSSEWLRAVGIADAATLRAVGAVEAFRRVKAAFPRHASWLLLYALHGALTNTHWNAFPPEVKAQMREEVLSQGALTPPGPQRSGSRSKRR